MIFVTVGTDTHEFERLVKAVDKLPHKLVIIQKGHTSYTPKHAQYFSFETTERIEELYKKADCIITHGGAGSILKSLSQGKTPIVVPRRKQFNEHVNDHQLDLATTLANHKKIILVTDVNELRNAIKKTKKITLKKAELPQKLGRYLQSYEKS